MDEELCQNAHAVVVYGYVREVGAHRVRATASDIDGHLTACEFDVTIE
jgi:hypothetical protein